MTKEDRQKTISELENLWYDAEAISWIIRGLEDEKEYDTEYVYKTLFKKEFSYA